MANINDGTSIVLKINDVVVPMNHFVESVFINVIHGLVETLDKIPEVKSKIEVLIEKN
jgi:hypothetical protein